jgi:hypothetical protein
MDNQPSVEHRERHESLFSSSTFPLSARSGRTSSNSDHMQAEREKARLRLELEKEDRRRENAGRDAGQQQENFSTVESPNETPMEEVADTGNGGANGQFF